jgi:DNA-binding beta-propeller fold protein YncE
MINIYETKMLSSNPPPIATINIAGCPYGMVSDSKGTLYVANHCKNAIEEYAKGSTTLKAMITKGIKGPLGLAIDRSGNLYVSEDPPAICVFPRGATKPSKTIKGGGMQQPFGLALDNSGNLLIADPLANAVFEIPAGSRHVKKLGLANLGQPIGLAYDLKRGYLWEAGGSYYVVNIYKLPSDNPIKTIRKTSYYPYAISLQNDGTLKGEVVIAGVNNHTLYAFKPGKYKYYATLSNNIYTPEAVLITQPL